MPAEKIELEDVKRSSNLSGLGYNAAKSILAVRFKSGDIYHYATVPAAIAAQLYEAESMGRAYGEMIRGKYTGQKMTGHCKDCGDLGWVGDRCADCGCSEYSEDPRKAQAAPVAVVAE